MRTLVTLLAAAAAILAVSAQRYQQPDANYVDEYESYDSARPNRPSPRSYGSAPPTSQRQSEGPAAPKPTPVAILKQINRHNEDGSYTYGFEGGDGSFKIETKLPNGEVKGKYGFVDDTGKVRVVEYGANQYGFQPAGDGITVAPPTLVDETTSKEALQEYQEYQQPARPAPAQRPAPQPQYQQPQYQQPPPSYQQPAAAYQQPPPSHTQALYAAQQAPARSQPVPKPPVFAPALQSPIQQAPSQHAQRPQVLRAAYEDPAPPSQLYNQGPAQFAPAPVQEHRSQPQPRSQNGGILDQLARDYALPQGGAAPLHDISFGYY